MSATIGANDIKLSVFGKGYEDERADSGVGVKSDKEGLGFPVHHAVFDETGDYCWMVTGNGCHKFETENWTDVGQSVVPIGVRYGDIFLAHPNNVENNYGFAIVDNTDAYLFDLTDDTLIAHNNTGVNLPFGRGNDADCILIGDKIWFVARNYANTNPPIMSFDVNDLSYTRTNLGNVGVSGFFDNDHLFALYMKEWFYQTSKGYCFDKSGNVVWQTEAFNNNDNVAPYGMTANGKIILPTFIHGAWRFGVYNGLPVPSVNPPRPIKTFGKFTDTLSMVYRYGAQYSAQYNIGRTKACVMTTCGLLYTDFNDVTVLDTEPRLPKGMNDKWLLCAHGERSDWNGYLYRIG